MNRGIQRSIGVVFGGRSGEHEVSIITAHQVMDALDVAGFDVLPIYIAKDGAWYAGKGLQGLDKYRTKGFHPARVRDSWRVSLSPDTDIRELVPHPDSIGFFSRPPRLWADVFFPSIHGTFGEDGTIQGLFELAGVPYVGSGVLGSGIAMDKVVTKTICREVGVPVLPCVTFSRGEWRDKKAELLSRVEAFHSYPLIVKPACLGSSIGVKRCSSRAELEEAIAAALVLDTRVLIEEALQNFFEINCSVVGPPYRASICERPLRSSDVLTFDEKYKGGGKGAKGGVKGAGAKGGGMASLQREFPAKISEQLTKRIQELAVTAFAATQSSGLARIDFMVREGTEDLYLTELNNPPGSFAFYLWEATGVSFDTLVKDLVNIAVERGKQREETLFSFSANLLQGV